MRKVDYEVVFSLLGLGGVSRILQGALAHKAQLPLYLAYIARKLGQLNIRGGQRLARGHHLVKIPEGFREKMVGYEARADKHEEGGKDNKVVPDKAENYPKRVIGLPDNAAAQPPCDHNKQQSPSGKENKTRDIFKQKPPGQPTAAGIGSIFQRCSPPPKRFSRYAACEAAL